MFYVEKNNQKIGQYLGRVIDHKYESRRKFCRAYLKKVGQDDNDEELRKMGNRLSQIIQGKKSIQTYDLPIMTDLLGVSCEAILSAGKCHTPVANRVTNYQIAMSKNEREWQEYIDRPDKLILNSDEYGKTILDYAFEFSNYKFLKFLMNKGYIWFVDESKTSWDLGVNYGAGTSIQRRQISYVDNDMILKLKYEDSVRRDMIVLAIENNDYEVLDKLKARENPTLYAMGLFGNSKPGKADCYNEWLINAVSDSGEKILDYFSEEFQIVDQTGQTRRYVFPYLGEASVALIKKKRREAELLIRRALSHNKKVYEELSKLIKEAQEIECNRYDNIPKEFTDSIKQQVLNYFYIDRANDMVSFFFSRAKKDFVSLVTNIITINAMSESPLLNELIEETNDYYDKIIVLKGE